MAKEILRRELITTEAKTSEAAENNKVKRKTIKKMQSLVLEFVEHTGLDQHKYENMFKSTYFRKSEYGVIPTYINTLASIYAWPIPAGGDAKDIAHIQDELLEILDEREITIDPELFLDIKEFKGYHTFTDDDYQTVECVEPEFDEYRQAIIEFADAAKIEYIDYALEEKKWHRTENKSVREIQMELDALAASRAEDDELNEA